MNKKNCITQLLLTGLLTAIWSVQAQHTEERYDIIVSEIMADPTPAIGLPVAEYIELHNRTGHSIAASGWKIKIGNTTKALPGFSIDSMGYAVILADKYREAYESIASNLITLSSLSITDAGQSIVLYNAMDEVIHSVTFRKEWHRERIKQDGGWSLEIIDMGYPCAGEENWDSSVGTMGGTPGAENSIRGNLDDGCRVEVSHVTMLDSATVRIFFSGSIRPELPIANEIFDISPSLTVSSIREVAPDFRALDIQFQEALHPNVRYDITLSAVIPGCGEACSVTGGTVCVGVPYPPAPGDLVINEVLTHPFEGADADFIEIYNRSGHIIDLKYVKIGSGGDEIPAKAVAVESAGRQLFPGEYCALCKRRQHTLAHYHCDDERKLVACDSLPAYANGSGTVFLTTVDLRTIDRFVYDESMHYSGLLSTEGVSLERVCTDCQTQDASNWHSAASTAGYGTPGYRNSQVPNAIGRDSISIMPEVFSPDNDGFDDYTTLHLDFRDNENRLTVAIYDMHGHCMKHLTNNEPCGTEATVRWDGKGDHGEVLPQGTYVVVIRWWNANGQTHRTRKVVSIRR